MHETVLKLNKLRKKASVPGVFSALLLLAAFSAALILATGGLPSNLGFLVYLLPLVLLVAACILFIFYNERKKSYFSAYATLVPPAALDEMLDSFTPDTGLDEQALRDADLLDTFSTAVFHRRYNGQTEGMTFDCANCSLSREDGELIFGGRWYAFRFDRPFRMPISSVSVRAKGFAHPAKEPDGSAKNKVRLDSGAFSRSFTVYAPSPESASALLTADVTNAMLALAEKTEGKLLFAFRENTLTVAVHQPYANQEPPVFRALREENVSEKALKELKALVRFLKELEPEKKLQTS